MKTITKQLSRQCKFFEFFIERLMNMMLRTLNGLVLGVITNLKDDLTFEFF